MLIGERILRIKSCSSTNDHAEKLALEGGEEGAVVIADEQTEGRGTKERTWFSARNKGLYLSIILRPPQRNISLLPLLAGVAVSDALYEAEGIRIGLKWPNDLIWKNKKLGGVLCEGSFSGDHLNYVILGIGLNIRHGKGDFPEEIRSSATSLQIITEKKVDKDLLCEKLWDSLNLWYGCFLHKEARVIVETFQRYAVFHPGERIILDTEEGQLSGIYCGIDTRGGLILEYQKKKKSFFAAQIKANSGNGGIKCY